MLEYYKEALFYQGLFEVKNNKVLSLDNPYDVCLFFLLCLSTSLPHAKKLVNINNFKSKQFIDKFFSYKDDFFTEHYYYVTLTIPLYKGKPFPKERYIKYVFSPYIDKIVMNERNKPRR